MKTVVKNSVNKVATNNTKKVATKTKVANKVATNKDLPLTKVVAKVEKKPSSHKLLIEANKAYKTETYSLSGAIKNYRKYAVESGLMKDFISELKIEEALKFDNVLLHVSEKCKETKKFSLWAIGLAVNKYLKSEL